MKRCIILVYTFSLLLILAGCSQIPSPNQIPSQLPDAAKNQLETAISNWNQIYGMNAQALKWTYRGRIDTNNDLTTIVNQILSPDLAWIPSVNPQQPGTTRAFLLSNQINQIPDSNRFQWENTVKSLIQVGMHVVQIN